MYWFIADASVDVVGDVASSVMNGSLTDAVIDAAGIHGYSTNIL